MWLRQIAKLELPTQKIEEDQRTIVVRYTPLGVAVGIVSIRMGSRVQPDPRFGVALV